MSARSSHVGRRASRRRTCVSCHVVAPCDVAMPRSVNAFAMPLRLVTPAARSSAMIGANRRPGIDARLYGLRSERAGLFADDDGLAVNLAALRIRPEHIAPLPAQLHAALLGCGERGLGPFADLAATWLAGPWRHIAVIGLSATPWARGLGKYFDRLLVGATTRQLIDAGRLSKFRVFAPASPDRRQ
jgi:hypothetical protein